MTREISQLAQKEGYFTYHITGEKFVHPDNLPDAFEKRAFAAFHAGQQEIYCTEKQDGKTLFRYMAPLHLESSCMTCHQPWGDRPGDIHGGLSVSFDIGNIVKLRRINRGLFLLTGIFGLLILSAGVSVYAKRLFRGIAHRLAPARYPWVNSC